VDTDEPGTARGEAACGLACAGEQRGSEEVYRAAYRYDSRWRKGTAVMFLLEGALASVLLLEADSSGQAIGYYFAADAALAGALFFAPRKEVYTHDIANVKTTVRYDCPEGVALAIGRSNCAK